MSAAQFSRISYRMRWDDFIREIGVIRGKLPTIAPRVPVWRNGRRTGLKILGPQGRAGSSPATGTN
jgi:hypothetical protein